MATILALHENSAIDNEINMGGIGGMIFEGTSGIGKSAIVRHFLQKNGYIEIKAECSKDQAANNHMINADNKKIYYVIPASMGNTKKEQLLLKTFDQGALVIIDEFNSLPMIERLLNSLLMDINLEGEKAKSPGFMIIGTQNPVGMGGRNTLSTAIKNRVLIVLCHLILKMKYKIFSYST